MPSARAEFLTLVLATTGCAASAGVPLETVGAAYAEAYCGRVFACCSPPEIAARFQGAEPPVRNEAGCAAYLGRVFQNEFGSDVARAQAASQARYDAQRMAACLDTLRGLDCASFHGVFLLPPCTPPPVEGLVSEGGACDHDFQCTSGYCAGRLARGTGACKAPPPAGAPCPEARCAEGLRCDSAVTPARCEPLLDDGVPCASDLACKSAACSEGVCGRPIECVGGG